MNISNWRNATVALSIFFSFVTSAYADTYSKATADIQPDVSPLYFGSHLHYLVPNSDEVKKFKSTKWPNNILGSIRLWDSRVRWADMAPNPGKWDFSRMDTYISEAIINNAEVMYTLGSTPQWASARPFEKCPYGLGCAAEPADMSDWEDYVRAVSKRYRGKIAIYELWNEPFFTDIPRAQPPGSFYTGSLDKMIEMARIARSVLDQEDPKAKLSAPGFDDQVEQLDLFLSRGGKKYIQAIDFHFYSHNSKHMSDKINNVKAIMQKQGVSDLPLFNTEQGVRVFLSESVKKPGEVSQVAASAKIAQYLILGASAGISRFYQYSWDNEFMGGMVNTQRVKLPSFETYTKTRSWLLNNKMLGCIGISPEGVVCHAEKSGERFIYAWAITPGVYSITLPEGFSVGSVEKLNGIEEVNLDGFKNKFYLEAHPMMIKLKI